MSSTSKCAETPSSENAPVLRKIHGRAHSGRITRGIARKATLLVQPAQNRRCDHLSVFGQAMTGGHERVALNRAVAEVDAERAALVTTPTTAMGRYVMALP